MRIKSWKNLALIIAGIITIGTGVLLVNAYKTNKEYKKKNSTIVSGLSKRINELKRENFILDDRLTNEKKEHTKTCLEYLSLLAEHSKLKNEYEELDKKYAREYTNLDIKYKELQNKNSDLRSQNIFLIKSNEFYKNLIIKYDSILRKYERNNIADDIPIEEGLVEKISE